MHFKSLKISHLRNIEELAVEFHPDFNLITGDNGSGKTSLIEALYLLAVGRSFRVNGNAALIQHNFDALTLFALLSEQKRIGLEKHKQGQTRLRLDQQAVNSSSEVATLLPVQLIYQDIFSIIDAGPGVRRSLLEWGMFYQNKEYFSYWKKYKRILKQRNLLLRSRQSASEIRAWDQPLSRIAAILGDFRADYIQLLQTVFDDVLQQVSDLNVYLRYYCGWGKVDQSCPLETILEQQFERDLVLGYTQSGAHRADMIILADQKKAKGKLSRGQQKLLLIALKIAQGLLLEKSSDKQVIYLFDDLSAELDGQVQLKLADLLVQLRGQKFVTALDVNTSRLFMGALPGIEIKLKNGYKQV